MTPPTLLWSYWNEAFPPLNSSLILVTAGGTNKSNFVVHALCAETVRVGRFQTATLDFFMSLFRNSQWNPPLNATRSTVFTSYRKQITHWVFAPSLAFHSGSMVIYSAFLNDIALQSSDSVLKGMTKDRSIIGIAIEGTAIVAKTRSLHELIGGNLSPDGLVGFHLSRTRVLMI